MVTRRRSMHGGRPTECARDRPPPPAAKHLCYRESNFFIFFFRIFSHFYVQGRFVLWDASISPGLARPPLTILSDMSLLMLSNHLRFSLPLPLSPGTPIAITLLPTYSSSLLNICPYHFNLLSCTLLDISPTFVVSLILSFLILSSFLLSIRSATSRYCSYIQRAHSHPN